ncbi:MAG: hypothetical protein Q4E99_03065, partial [Bacillota bacterium]|nr:hypothetical protein [Bacillota bacterium]
MNNMYKKLIAFVLALAMVFTGSVMAFALSIEEDWTKGTELTVGDGKIKLADITAGEEIALQNNLLEWAKTKVEITGGLDGFDVDIKLELDPTTQNAISGPSIQITTKPGIMSGIRSFLDGTLTREEAIAIAQNIWQIAQDVGNISGEKFSNLVTSLSALLSPDVELDLPYVINLLGQIAELGEDRFNVLVTFGNKGVYGDGDIQINTTITQLIDLLEGLSTGLTQYIGNNVSDIACAAAELGS